MQDLIRPFYRGLREGSDRSDELRVLSRNARWDMEMPLEVPLKHIHLVSPAFSERLRRICPGGVPPRCRPSLLIFALVAVGAGAPLLALFLIRLLLLLLLPLPLGSALC